MEYESRLVSLDITEKTAEYFNKNSEEKKQRIIDNIFGKKVRNLADEQQTSGTYQFGWDGLDEYKAMFHGWKTRTIFDLHVNHLAKKRALTREATL